MNIKEKTDLRIDATARAAIKEYEYRNKYHPGIEFIKDETIPEITKKANGILDDSDNPDIDESAIGSITEQWVWNHWSDIGLQVAKKYHKFIIWNSRGTRLGTIEEYIQCLGSLYFICIGISDFGSDMARMIRNNGGEAAEFQVRLQLTRGKEPDKDTKEDTDEESPKE